MSLEGFRTVTFSEIISVQSLLRNYAGLARMRTASNLSDALVKSSAINIRLHSAGLQSSSVIEREKCILLAIYILGLGIS